VDIVSFTLIRIGSTWNVLGSLSGGAASSVQDLEDLSNVTISNVSDGQVLKYNASTDRWVNAADLTGAGGTGISLSDLSVTVAAASGNGTLAYSSSTGIFTFTPPSLTSFITLNSISATGDIDYNNSTGVISFNNTTGFITRSGISATGDVSYNNSTGVISFNNTTGFITRTGISATGDVSYNNSTGVISFNNSTGYITRSGISVTQAAASGNGSLVYNNTTGVLTYTPPDLSSAGGGTASDSFTTIAVAGQNNVVADSSADTLTLVAGTGMSITTNASTDTITFTNTASSGATAFTGLSDSAGLTVDRFYLPAITMLTTTNNGASSYRFDQYGTADNPTVYAINGTTIAFNLNVSGHPFLIQTSGGANYNEGLVHVTTAGAVTTGASAQGQTSGTLYWKVPTSISGNYRYICSIHSSMVGVINIKQISAL
jgi:plastocyanin